MQKRLFFLKQDGWFEAEITAKLLNSPSEELFQWTYAMMDKHGYRNYLITENPGPVFGTRYWILDTGHWICEERYLTKNHIISNVMPKKFITSYPTSRLHRDFGGVSIQ